MVCADFDAYVACEARAAAAYTDTRDWSRRALFNIAGASRFSSDATIRQYAAEIWSLQPVKTDFALLEKEPSPDEGAMTKREMSDAVLAAKKSKGLTWAKLAEAVGLGEVWLASCGHGENCLDAESAGKLAGILGLAPDVTAELVEPPPLKGWSMDKPVPTDPLIYRFYENRGGLRHDAEGRHPGEVRSRDHERHRLQAGDRQGGEPEGRPRGREAERQVLALHQVVAGAAAMPGFRLGIFIFKDAEIVDFAAPYGVFSVARRFDPELDVFFVAESMRPVQAQAGFTVLPNYSFADQPAMDAFLIPGGFGTRQEMHNRRLHEYVRSLPDALPAHQRVHRIMGLRQDGPARRPARHQPQGA